MLKISMFRINWNKNDEVSYLLWDFLKEFVDVPLEISPKND